MAGVNKVILIGNLGADPEVKEFESGKKVASFNLATSESWKDNKTGERKTATEWHRCEVWGGAAGVAEKYLRKGSPVYVEGSIKTDAWKDQDGNDKSIKKIKVHSLTLLGSGTSSSGSGTREVQEAEVVDSGADDDLPF